MRRTVPALSLTRGSAVRRRHGEQAKGLVFGEHQQRDHKQIRGSFPFDPIAIVAQVIQSDAYFEKKDCQITTDAYEDFVNSTPDDENAAHALRQLGEGYEEQTLTINRDQAITLKAVNRFTFVKNRYPTSSYAKDAYAHLSALTRKLDIELTGRCESSAIECVATASILRLEYFLHKYPAAKGRDKAFHHPAQGHRELYIPEKAGYCLDKLKQKSSKSKHTTTTQ
ncbi:MAG TPA: outer membrane protein assembly factor BamD [Syntrophorhabdales bacterium]|nr:outer membrane protein assembly factor BamD [Syntrophorhabdales bacterium]